MKRSATTAAIAAGATGLAVAAAALFTARTTRKVEAAVARDGTMIEVGGHQLHVAEEGSGPPLLLIHGLGGQMRNFAPALVKDLARDYRVIRVDRPGSGYSPRTSGEAANLKSQARVIAALIEQLGLERPTIVGHSLGGALALTLAVEHSEKVGWLLLIAPATQLIGQVPEAFRGLQVPPAMRRMIGLTIAVPMATMMSRTVLEQVFRPEQVPDNFAIAGGGALGFRASAFEGAAADLAEAEADMDGVLDGYTQIKVPTAILFGRGDAILDFRVHGERTATQIPGAQLTLVEGGHMLPFTQPLETARWIRQSLTGSANG